jgi:hypothetical protein
LTGNSHRFLSSRECNGSDASYPDGVPAWSCSAGTPEPTADNHDSVVMSVMAGSIEAGQDPNYPLLWGMTTQDQVDRSGIASGPTLRHYMLSHNDNVNPTLYLDQDIAQSFEQAILDYVDILTLTYSVGGWGEPDACGPPNTADWCTMNCPSSCLVGLSPNADGGGVNTMIHNAFGSGILIVASPGDDNGNPTYSLNGNQHWPSNRPEVLSSNGTWTTYDGSGNAPVTPSMGPGAWVTSSMPIGVYNGSSYSNLTYGNVALGPDAPGYVGLGYQDVGGSLGYDWGWYGSSFSAPIVAGGAALLQNAWWSAGFGVRPNYYLKADLLMLTDGYYFSSYTGAQTGRNPWLDGTSQYSGPGRQKLRYPQSGSFTSSWGWGWGTFVLGPGGSHYGTIPANIQHYRLAIYWVETDLSHAADIDMHVNALDANGNVCASNFAYQSDYSLQNVINIKRSEIPACAVTLQPYFATYAMPAGQTRTVYAVDLWDNETSY